jgi:hypothetical protein
MEAVLSFNLPEESVRERLRQIHEDVLAQSRHLRQPNFTAIHPRDLEFLFEAYDQRFLTGHARRALEGRSLAFRLAPRLTRAGGKTTRFATRAGEVSYEIAIAISMLFDAFGKNDRSISICGVECPDRLQALQRIFEHEFVHLLEQLCWHSSKCAAARFQDIAQRFFQHRTHTHELITRRERAAHSGIRPGAMVSFICEGRRLTGRVNRITKRVTVLVPDAEGRRYSDGGRYQTYYVPLAMLEPAVSQTEPQA